MSTLVVAAVVRRGQDVLLVRQQGPQDPASCWALLGGRVEQGETLSQALTREVREETGLHIVRLGVVRCISHALDTAARTDCVALTFEVDEWSGEPYPGDPDGYVSECAFFPPERAAELLSALPWRSMREPGMSAVMQTGGSTRLFEYSDL